MRPHSSGWWKRLFRRPTRTDRLLATALRGFPQMVGAPLTIEFSPRLTARRGKLESGGGRGVEVHAASFLRQRRVVLDRDLIGRPRELSRILAHELFHFVWLRAGNPARRSFESLIEAEHRRRTRGELGWSAERRKLELTPEDRRRRSRAWREYVCESFCDSAAWLLGPAVRHDEFTLAPRFRAARKAWFATFLGTRELLF
jgi:hypothetical protein